MMQNNSLEQLYIERHDTLIGIVHHELDRLENIDNAIEAEDIVQDLYIVLGEEGIPAYAIDDMGCFEDSYIHVILPKKINTIINNNYLVD
jgi:hypothetical protein